MRSDLVSPRPFVVEHLALPADSGHFTPAARVVVTPQLRESGLLAALPPDLAATLLALLTFTTPNGSVEATAEQIASARALSPAQAEGCLARLARITLADDLPVVQLIEREQSLPVYRLSQALLANEEVAAPSVSATAVQAGSREAVIAHSRQAFARSRAEVEAEVERQLGANPEESADSEEGQVRRRLLAIGVARPEIDRLVEQYSLASIRQQLEWLPLRRARMPARYVIAAIEEDYSPPLALRTEHGGSEESAESALLDGHDGPDGLAQGAGSEDLDHSDSIPVDDKTA